MSANPFVVNISDVLRRDGASRELQVETAVDWTLELSEVLPDPPLHAVLEASRVSGGVLFRGTVSVAVRHSCNRCLEPVDDELTVELAQLFVDGPDAEGEDAEDYVLDGEIVDLEPLLRDEVLLALPILPKCPDGCDRELVAGGESDLNTGSPADDTGGSSPFAVLKDLLGD